MGKKSKKKNKRRRRNNTQQSPLPNIGDMTPQSVVIRDSESEYISSSNESEPHPSNNGQTFRSNAISNIKASIIQNQHRQSRTQTPKSIKKNDLFNIYHKNQTDSAAKAYFSNITKSAKSNKFEVEKKARNDIEKMYKPQLQKTKLELAEARRKSQEQSEEMLSMKRELQELKAKQSKEHSASNKQNETKINTKLRKANLEIQELQSKLKFEKQKYQISNSSLANMPNMQTLAISKPTINRRHSARYSSTKTESETKQLFEGLHRLKKKNSHKNVLTKSITSTLKKRRSLPERQLWTDRSAIKETDDSNEDALKKRIIQKRKSMLLAQKKKKKKKKKNFWPKKKKKKKKKKK